MYNQYNRVSETGNDAAREAGIALFRPLFGTSFLLNDFLLENEFFGARSVVSSSASSKIGGGILSSTCCRVT